MSGIVEFILGLAGILVVLSAVGFFGYTMYTIGKVILPQMITKKLTLKDLTSPILGLLVVLFMIRYGIVLAAQASYYGYEEASPYIYGLAEMVIGDIEGAFTSGAGDLSTGVRSANNPNPSNVPDYIEHRVGVNENIVDIAELYGLTAGQLLAYNDMQSYNILAGTIIRIPTNGLRAVATYAVPTSYPLNPTSDPSFDPNTWNLQTPPPTPTTP